MIDVGALRLRPIAPEDLRTAPAAAEALFDLDWVSVPLASDRRPAGRWAVLAPADALLTGALEAGAEVVKDLATVAADTDVVLATLPGTAGAEMSAVRFRRGRCRRVRGAVRRGRERRARRTVRRGRERRVGGSGRRTRHAGARGGPGRPARRSRPRADLGGGGAVHRAAGPAHPGRGGARRGAARSGRRRRLRAWCARRSPNTPAGSSWPTWTTTRRPWPRCPPRSRRTSRSS
ncbi:hypothetical protein LT493_43705 [Streptomyces tricolor]|nr:hypothetical protein [Streptomyces tricolor]